MWISERVARVVDIQLEVLGRVKDHSGVKLAICCTLQRFSGLQAEILVSRAWVGYGCLTMYMPTGYVVDQTLAYCA